MPLNYWNECCSISTINYLHISFGGFEAVIYHTKHSNLFLRSPTTVVLGIYAWRVIHQFEPFLQYHQVEDMVNQWITEIGFIGYNLSIFKKIIGDLENGPMLNSIILITKKVIYDSFKKDKIPSIFQIKSEVKNHYYLEKYIYRNNGKIQLFEKNWHLLTLKYENAWVQTSFFVVIIYFYQTRGNNIS